MRTKVSILLGCLLALAIVASASASEEATVLGNDEVVVFTVTLPDGQKVTAYEPIGREVKITNPAFGTVMISPTAGNRVTGAVQLKVSREETLPGVEMDVAFADDVIATAVGDVSSLPHNPNLEIVVEAVITVAESPIDVENYYFAKEYGIQLACCVTCGSTTACGSAVTMSCGSCSDFPCHS